MSLFHHVRYHLKAVYLSFHWYLIYYDCFVGMHVRIMSKLGAMSKIECCKSAPIFEIQLDLSFRWISVKATTMTARTQNREIPPS